MHIQGTFRADALAGGMEADWLTGGDGDDQLTGDAGADTLDGGAGRDWVAYRFDLAPTRAGDAWYDHGGAVNFDGRRVGSAVAVAVADGRGGVDRLTSIEALMVAGTEHGDVIRGGTTALANALTGFGGDDKLYGGDGADVLNGDGAWLIFSDSDADTLVGGAGDDVLTGGRDGDRMVGGAGADRFTYLFLDSDATESSFAYAGRDVIQDFGRADGDRIDLSARGRFASGRDLTTFRFVGGFTGGMAEVMSLTVGTGEDAYALALADLDGDLVADLVIAVRGVDALIASDFIL